MSSVWTESQAGPASYATGGFVVTTTLASVDSFAVQVASAGANLGRVDFDVALNSPAAGQVTVKVIRRNYDKLTTLGAVTSLPSGVTSRATSGGTYDNDAAHTHALDHNHAAATSSTPNAAGGGTPTGLNGNVSSHTHSFDPPNHTGNTGAGDSHTHTWDKIYEHQHVVTNTATNAVATELAAGTDLSGATLNLIGVDV